MLRRCANPRCDNLFIVSKYPPINTNRYIYCSDKCREYVHNRNEERKEWIRKIDARRKRFRILNSLPDL